MKFTISKSELIEGLKVVSKGLSSRTTLPILSGILLRVDDESLTLQTTDLEVSVKHVMKAFIENSGEVVVPGKLFTDIVSSLPDAAVQIGLEGRVLSISCQQTNFSIKTLQADDFPGFPVVESDRTVTVPASLVSGMVRQVSKAVSKDESRAILTGILFSMEGTSLKFVATDSYRLAIRETQLETSLEESIEAVIPGRILDEVTRAATGSDSLSIGISENQIVFSFGSTVIVTRRIEGVFPNYKQLLPKEQMSTAVVSTEELLSSVRRVALLAKDQSSVKMTLAVDDQNLNLSSNAADMGAATEDLMVKVEGQDAQIAFNHQYLTDGLVSVHTESLVLELQASNRPGILKAFDEKDVFIYLMMPVRLS